ncbi:MAG: hypothetical protein ABIP89_25550 [Polyangiaceae bacterium]
MTRSWNQLRLPIALIFGQIIALGAGIGACSGADPFTNIDGDAGDGTEDGSVDSGKHDAGKDSGKHDAATMPEGSTGDGGITDSGPVIVDPGFDASLYCAQAVCNSQFCCGSGLIDGGFPATYTCQNPGTTCAGVHELCDDLADCHGKLCCATLSGGHVTSIGCATSCGAGLRVCDPNVATDCSTTGGGTCMEMPQLPGSNQFYCQ